MFRRTDDPHERARHRRRLPCACNAARSAARGRASFVAQARCHRRGVHRRPRSTCNLAWRPHGAELLWHRQLIPAALARRVSGSAAGDGHRVTGYRRIRARRHGSSRRGRDPPQLVQSGDASGRRVGVVSRAVRKAPEARLAGRDLHRRPQARLVAAGDSRARGQVRRRSFRSAGCGIGRRRSRLRRIAARR